MVVRPDSPESNDPATASTAGDQRHTDDLSLNDPTLAGDFGDGPDPRLQPEVDALPTFGTDQATLERRHSVPPDVSWPAARAGVQVTTEAINDLEKHLAALAGLRDVCERIDQRLVRAEAVSERRDGATTDAVLHDVCAQIYDRLVRVEAALQRTEGFVADKPWDLSTIAFKRLELVEDTLRLTQKSFEDSTLPEMCVNIERQLIQTRMALQRTEEAVADRTLRELCANIDARLVRTEDTLRRTEGIVAEWLQKVSASMTERFAEAEETIQRIERIVSSETVEQPPPRQPSERMDSRPIQAEETAHFVSIKQTKRAVRLPWMAGVAVPVFVLVAGVAIGVLIRTPGGAAPEKVVPLAPTDQTSTPVAPAPAPQPTRAVLVSAPQQTSPPDRELAPISARPRTFVGTLSITSVPSGASVSINGKVSGVTPMKLPRQRAGSLAVQIAHDGFERWSAAVRVPADRLTEVTARLRPIVQ